MPTTHKDNGPTFGLSDVWITDLDSGAVLIAKNLMTDLKICGDHYEDFHRSLLRFASCFTINLTGFSDFTTKISQVDLAAHRGPQPSEPLLSNQPSDRKRKIKLEIVDVETQARISAPDLLARVKIRQEQRVTSVHGIDLPPLPFTSPEPRMFLEINGHGSLELTC